MLIEFSVKNFMSFKNKVTLSMEKGNGLENEENVVFDGDINVLKSAAIYGANASGKSNLLKAFTCAILMVRTSSLISVGQKWAFLRPFLFDEESKNKPSEFEFVFKTNGVKYKYYFSADENKVYNEVLDAYYTQKPTNIFRRTNTNNYEFYVDKKKLEALSMNNTENKLFLATATTWNYDKTKDAYLWFVNGIDTYDSFNNITDKDLIAYSNDSENLKEFALKLLNKADILIKDVTVHYEEKEIDNLLLAPLEKSNDKYKVKNIIERLVEKKDRNKLEFKPISMNKLEKQDFQDINYSFIEYMSYCLKKYGKNIDDYTESLTVIERQNTKTTEIISQLLQLSRLEQGRIKDDFEYSNFKTLIESVCDMEPLQFKKQITIYSNLDDISIYMNVGLMAIAVKNIINNAMKYSKNKSSIKLKLWKEKDYVFFEVKDYGCGMSEETKKHIYDRFYRADKSRNTEGFGLGLSLVHKIIELHKGTIRVQSELGVGSIFTLSLPSDKSSQ